MGRRRDHRVRMDGSFCPDSEACSRLYHTELGGPEVGDVCECCGQEITDAEIAILTTPKARRRKLAKAELWLLFAVKASEWRRWMADALDDEGNLTWATDDPFRRLCDVYGLRASEVMALLDQIGKELEARAERAGYDESWSATADNMDTASDPNAVYPFWSTTA